MSAAKGVFLSIILLLPLSALAASDDTENASLKAQVEQLQSQLRAIQAQCPTASIVAPPPSAAAPVSPPARTAIAVPSATPAVQAAATAATANAVPAAAEPASSAATTPAPPAGYKLVKVDPNEEPPLPKDDRWRDPANWDMLVAGMSMNEVESILGVEHRVISAKGRVQWGYGKIGRDLISRVIFVDGRLAVWERPSF
jgi:hypothetical protein